MNADVLTAKHDIVSDLLQVRMGSAAACFLAAAAAAFLGASTFLCSWLFGFWNSGETDQLRTISSISGPGINAFSLGSWLQRENVCLVFVDSDSSCSGFFVWDPGGKIVGALRARSSGRRDTDPSFSNDVRDAVVESPEYLF